MRPRPERLFPPILAALLAVMAVAMIVAAAGESQTYDEGFHLSGGFSYWKTGDYRLNVEHPPLAKLLQALPLLFTRTGMPQRRDAWDRGDQVEMSHAFLYQNRLHADTMLLLGRIPTMLFALTLVVAVALVARRRWGPAAALCAAALCALDPNLIAHGHYVTSDVPVSLAVLLSALTWDRYLDSGRRKHLAIAALVLGVALAIKFSALYLVGVHWILYYARRNSGVRRPLAACLGALLVVGAAYGPDTVRAIRGEKGPLQEVIRANTPAGVMLSGVAADLRLPAHPYLAGMWELTSHNEEGHRAYLLGRVEEKGSWLYFPVAFAVKTPAAALLLLVLAIVVTVGKARGIGLRTWLLALYPAVYFAICMAGRLNLGLRHLLPIYPFLYLWIGWAVAVSLAGTRRRIAIVVLSLAALVHATELARVHPHYTAFFNTIAGGPANGHRYLLDSNLDWGQDAKNLRRWMDAHGVAEVCTSYFGTAQLGYYGVKESEILTSVEPAARESLDCLAAVSVNNYYDLYHAPRTHAWLRGKQPIATIGHSIWIFDLRQRRR